jgi:hypothetical protein
MAIPVGIAAAVYLEEFADRTKRLNRIIELNIQNLAAVPAIIYGMLALGVLNLIGLKNKNVVIGGSLALALLILPVVILTTREALRAVPQEIRDGSLALGATEVQTVVKQTLPSAIPGIATGIAQITFINRLPSGSSYHVINGIKVDRDRVMALPKNVDATALAIFEKISQFDPIPWVRSGWEGFQSSDKSRVIAKSFMDRDSRYTFYNAEETEERALTKVNICWTDRYNPEKLRKYMLNKLFSFHCQQTAYNGNISIGVMRTLTLPTNWEELVTDEQVYEAYGLTQTEINYLEQAVK